MSDFRLCIPRRNIKPYYSSIIKREIFTIEELSYFIYENIHLIDDDFIDKNLIEFVYNSIDEDISGFGLNDSIEVILRSNNLYLEEDVELIINILKNYREGDYLTRAKMIGDKCLINKDYNLALKHYNNILQRAEISVVDESFIFDVKFNKGVVLARMLNFKDSYQLFKELYELSEDEEVKFYCMLSLRYYDINKYNDMKKYDGDKIFESIDDIACNAKMDKIIYDNGMKYTVVIDDILDEWKHQVSEEL